MKLRYLTILVSTMVVTGPGTAAEVYNKDGNKLDLYGKLNGIRYLSSNDSKNGDHSSIRYGFHGEVQISDHDQLIGFGTWEQESTVCHSKNQDSIDNFTRLGFAGLKFGEAGSLDYGRNYGVLYDVGSWTDVMPEFGGDTTLADNFLSGRADGVLTYRNTDFFGIVNGLNFALQYQGKNSSNEDTGSSAQKENGDGYGLSVSYDFGNGVSAAAAYANSNRTQSQRALVTDTHYHGSKSKKAEAYSLGLRYDANSLYLAALYGETSNMTPFGKFSALTDSSVFGFSNKAKNIELVAQYQFVFGLRPSIGYLQSRINDDNGGSSHAIKKYIELGTSYNFNKNMLTFIDYRINLLSKNNFSCATSISTDNILSLGMAYMF
ncbi:MAG: outer membrane porin N [Sodalis sp. Psp]|nr:outer membrane porin N [Sodalis sp. Psp]MCR3756660.1 outer membrane porin N [Sodalis sp. Ppy]